MGTQGKVMRIWALVLLGLSGFVVGCQEETTGPTAAEFRAERDAVQAQVAQAKKNQAKKKAVPTRVEPRGESVAPSFASMDHGYTYDETGKRDPFRSFMLARAGLLRERESLGPLEQFDLAQLSVVAVVWKTGNARALVEDPSGESYIVAEGTRIGKNEGRVISIDDNSVLVTETYVDFLGQKTTKDIEMRMRLSEGG